PILFRIKSVCVHEHYGRAQSVPVLGLGNLVTLSYTDHQAVALSFTLLPNDTSVCPKPNLWSSVFADTETRRALSVVANPLRAPLCGLTCTSHILQLSFSINP